MRHLSRKQTKFEKEYLNEKRNVESVILSRMRGDIIDDVHLLGSSGVLSGVKDVLAVCREKLPQYIIAEKDITDAFLIHDMSEKRSAIRKIVDEHTRERADMRRKERSDSDAVATNKNADSTEAVGNH